MSEQSGETSWSNTATLPLREAKELFVTLGKALRAFQLYDENNPVYQRFVQALAGSLSALFESADSLTFVVEETRMTLEGEEVYSNPSKSESLSFLLFKDGIRTLTMKAGVEGETERILKALNTARHAKSDGDDLLTLLWEADLRFLEYRYVDLLAEGVSLPEPGDGVTEAELSEVMEEEKPTEEEAQDGEPSTAQQVNRDDFNPTLYALDPKEMEQLREELVLEQKRDVRRAVLYALFDRLEENNPARQNEIIDILRTLLPAYLARGELAAATIALRELRALEQTGTHFSPDQRNQVTALLNEASARSTITELIQALEDGALSPSPQELGAFLENLRAGALGSLLRGAETTQSRELQPILREAVVKIAQRNEMALIGLLQDDDPVVAAGAARLVGHNKLAAGIDGLLDLLVHGDPAVRLAAVEAAIALRASPAAAPLQEVLLDPDAEVRVAAARGLAELNYSPAARRLRAVVESKEIRQADITERIAMFEAYGTVGGDEALEVFDRMLNAKGFLGRREAPEIRACAALGLGKIMTQESREALMKASKDDDAVVRSAVGRAIRAQQEASGGPR